MTDVTAGSHFTKHLKPSFFYKAPYNLYGTYENLRLKMLSETGTGAQMFKALLA